jgi:hypothetical protein
LFGCFGPGAQHDVCRRSEFLPAGARS